MHFLLILSSLSNYNVSLSWLEKKAFCYGVIARNVVYNCLSALCYHSEITQWKVSQSGAGPRRHTFLIR
jgi:hypothetical protein